MNLDQFTDRIREITKEATLYRAAKLQLDNSPYKHKHSSIRRPGPDWDEHKVLWTFYEQSKQNLLDVCAGIGFWESRGSAILKAARYYYKMQCKYGKAYGACKMTKLMDSEERLMEACGLPSALNMVERNCTNAPRMSNIPETP